MGHGPYLGNGHVGLIHHQQKIFWEIIHQRERGLPRFPVVHVAGIILNAGTVTHLFHHFQIVIGTLLQTLGLQQLAIGFQLRQPLFQFRADIRHGPLHVFLAGHIMGRGKNRHVGPLCQHFPRQHVHFQQLFHFVVKHLDADSLFAKAGWYYFDYIAPHTEGAAVEIDIVPGVLVLHQLAQDRVAVNDLPYPQRNHGVVIILRPAQTVNTADAGHHDHVPPFKQRAGGAVTQLVDFVIDGRIFFYVCICLGNIRFRLIVVIVGNKIFHRVVWEEGFQFAGQLGRQGLVVSQHQGGPPHFVDDLGDGIGLACTCRAQQHLGAHALLNACRQFFNGLGLVARGLEWGFDCKIHRGLLL